ncbi:SGNH/GDSL hydrolase family protein [Saxibacter everestensis]|uniref:SGNH/GDSL hydrolase family protein n=1 Tax=Saxibacter everestensis TaxID=2909229 RepID=A0ABY8QYZ5_9MICO|nr:SGNH/GDSL hydrolase family protein [Brevibacteriaceae bacterium ZFBP1038]
MNSQLNDLPVPGNQNSGTTATQAADWITTPITADILRGALELEQTERGVLPHRLPAWARKQISDGQLAMAEAQPSGVRLVFRTRATAIELEVLPTKNVYEGAPPRPEGVCDLLVDGRLAGQATAPGGNVLAIDMTNGTMVTRPGPTGTVRFSGLSSEMKDVEIWLTFREITELVALRTNAPVEAALERGRRVWLHHGSSISHGSDTDSPTSTWPALAAAAGGVELINLGFGGGALLDPFVARALRDTPADLISVKLGINLVNADLMRLRAFGPAVHGFLDTIREGHPTVPLLVVSSVLCPIHERTPGPAFPDFSSGKVQFRATGDASDPTQLTLSVIREQLAAIVAQRSDDDPNLYYLDGRELYGEQDFAELPLPDQLHPDAAAHRRIGERFARLAFGDGTPFAADVA